MDADLKAIARGSQPKRWEKTYEHPEHGPLTFTAGLPTVMDLTRHAIAMDNMMEGLEGSPRMATQLLVAAITGIRNLMKLPVLSQDHQDDGEGHERVVTRFYDPGEEHDEGFVVRIWADFSDWRESFLAKVDELGNSSGTTDGSDSSESSIVPTDSPSTIPA